MRFPNDRSQDVLEMCFGLLGASSEPHRTPPAAVRIPASRRVERTLSFREALTEPAIPASFPTDTRPGHLIRLLTVGLTLGLTTGGVLAGRTHEEVTGAPHDNTEAPHETPYKAEPPTGGHKNLAAAATNPLANLMRFQFQYQYNARHHNTDDTSWSGTFQPVIPFKLPWKSVPTLITRTTIPL